MFSIYILTHNEEIDIAACIESALLSDDVIVIDSLSDDRTIEIASRYPVRVVQHAFESHGKQRTWMLRSIPARHEWVYILEADERMTSALFEECLTTIRQPSHVGYYVAERVMFMGTGFATARNILAISFGFLTNTRSGSAIMGTPSAKLSKALPGF